MSTQKATTLADLKPVFLAISEHQALLDEVVARIKARVADEADLNLNLDEFDADQASADEVVGAARVMPFLSDRRVVVVRDIHRWRGRDLETLAAYVEDPSPDACVVLTFKGVVGAADSRGGGAGRRPTIAADSSVYKAAKRGGYLLERPGPKWPSEYAPWVMERAKEMGLVLDRSAAAYLVESVGTDLVALITELEKLGVVYERGARLDREAVEAMVSPLARAEVKDYLEHVCKGDLADALRALADLSLGAEPTVVLARTISRLEELLRVRVLLDGGLKAAEIRRELKLRSDWLAKKQVELAQRFSAAGLVRLVSLAVAFEEDMKTSRLDGRLALDRLSVEISREIGG